MMCASAPTAVSLRIQEKETLDTCHSPESEVDEVEAQGSE